MDDENTTACAASPDEVKLTANGADNGIVITAQPIPEDPSEREPTEEKKRSNMVGRGDYVYTTKVTSTSTHRWDDRCASCNCGDAECCDVIFGCLLCHCLFGGNGSDGGDCGDCCSPCDCDCGNCDCDCGNCDCDFS